MSYLCGVKCLVCLSVQNRWFYERTITLSWDSSLRITGRGYREGCYRDYAAPPLRLQVSREGLCGLVGTRVTEIKLGSPLPSLTVVVRLG